MHVEATGCVSLTKSTTQRAWTLVFSSSFLFSHIFLLSHTFVVFLFCLGQMYVRDQLSVSSCLLQLSAAGDFFAGFYFSTPLQACVQFLVFVQHLSVAY